MIYILSFLWFIRTTKAVLFWLYLWQLKEYHLGRFLDHFRTEKGKRLLLNKIIILKIITLLLFFILSPLAFFITFFIYIIETLKTLLDFSKKAIIKPVLTKKTILLISVELLAEILFISILYNKDILAVVFLFLVFDVLTPLIVSIIVVLFQPLAVWGRNRMVKKAKAKREQFSNLLVIGITGSYGKTSTKEFLYTILAEKFGENKVLKTKEHQNSEVGVSQCILNDLNENHEIFVCEMASYNRGGIKLLCDITKPKIGILTGINEQHLSTQGSQENIIKTKYELIESLPEDDLAIFNGENLYCLELYQKTKIKKIICNINGIFTNGFQSDFWVENLKIDKEFIYFKMLAKKTGISLQEKWPLRDSADFKVNLLGAQNVENILLAAACAKELGMSLEEIALACGKIKAKQGSMKLVRNKEGLNILDSTYSANPNGVLSHLDYLKIWQGSKKVIVMPCLIELGRASKDVHRRIGQRIGEVCDLSIITTKERYKYLKEGAIEKGMDEKNILFIENSKKIYEKIKNFCQLNDVVLLESRVPKELIKDLGI